jgi:hypothetical protein
MMESMRDERGIALFVDLHGHRYAYVSICQHASAYVSILYVRIRQHTSAYVRIRPLFVVLHGHR